MKKSTRIIAVLMALAMMLALQTSVFAAEQPQTTPVPVARSFFKKAENDISFWNVQELIDITYIM